MIILTLPAWPLVAMVVTLVAMYIVSLIIDYRNEARRMDQSFRNLKSRAMAFANDVPPPPPPDRTPCNPQPPPEYIGGFTNEDFEEMRSRLRRTFIHIYKKRKRNYHYRKLKQIATHRPVRGLRKIIRFEQY